ARFALPRLGRLRALLAETLLRLPEIALRIAQVRWLIPLLCERWRGDSEHHQPDDDACDQSRHERARPLASSPPRAPRTAPPVTSASIWGSEKKTARSRPSVRGSSGSTLGTVTTYPTSSAASAKAAAASP